MVMMLRVKIRRYEVGLYFRDGEFWGLLAEGQHWLPGPTWKVRVDVVSKRDPWLVHDCLDVIAKSGALAGSAEVIDLKDYERALVWIDGRFSKFLRRACMPTGSAKRTFVSKSSMLGTCVSATRI